MSVYVVLGRKGPASLYIPCTAVSGGGHTCTAGVTEVCDHHYEEILALADTYTEKETLDVTRREPERVAVKSEDEELTSKSAPASTPKVKALTTKALEPKDEKPEPKKTTPVPEKF